MSTKIVAALGTAALLTAAGVLAAGASGEATTTAGISLSAKARGGTPLDLGRKGTSPGDQFLEQGVLSDAQGKAAGRFQMTTQLVSGGARHGQEQTTFVLYLSGGQLVATGGHATTSRFTLPVVGGTGSYRAAGGTLTIAPGKHGAEALDIELEG